MNGLADDGATAPRSETECSQVVQQQRWGRIGAGLPASGTPAAVWRETVARVADALDAILPSDPEIHDLRWWTADEVR